jgi:hypothetical protein
MHVDGFRFDLGTILAREPYGFDEGGGFLDSCRQDPVLSSVKLIAEPWDCGPGGYQVGRFPPGWAEWNDRYRDTVRAYWKGDDGTLPDFAARITGSSDLFNRRGRKPWASVNFITAHDGFTLNDLVSYNDRHNEANGEDNRDGHSDNRSWNHGVEGPTDDPEIIELRARQKRNILATLLLSQGTPMLLAGDEFGRSQQGNNNAYGQDNQVSWVDWDHDERAQALTRFVRRLTHLRDLYPVLRQSRFVTGAGSERLEIRDCTWLTPANEEMAEAHWAEPAAKCLGLLLDGRAQTSGTGRRGSEATLLLITNAHHDVVVFTLPTVPGGRDWLRLLDTNLHDQDEDMEDALPFKFGHPYEVTGRSLLLFLLRPSKGQFVFVGDPVGSGFVASLARPGRNITGFANFENSIGGKWLELLKEIAPAAKRAGFIFNPDAAPNVGFFHAAESATEPLAIGLAAIAVRDANDIKQDVTAFASEPDGGLIIAPHAVTLGNRTLIIELAARHRLPAVYSDRYFAESGGLISFGNNTADLFRRAASYIDLILKGAKPAELPVQLPTKFELIVNLKTAKSLGLTIPESFLSRADEVIE